MRCAYSALLFAVAAQAFTIPGTPFTRTAAPAGEFRPQSTHARVLVRRTPTASINAWYPCGRVRGRSWDTDIFHHHLCLTRPSLPCAHCPPPSPSYLLLLPSFTPSL